MPDSSSALDAPPTDEGCAESIRMDPLFRRPSISSESSSNSAQAGVRRLEAVSASWSKWSLYLAYAG